jgi:hypothetical protein
VHNYLACVRPLLRERCIWLTRYSPCCASAQYQALPELLDKFVLSKVPCYTEGENSLRRTIDSLADLDYDDKRKLIFFICDGNIIGSGNERPTPAVVLDILGVEPAADPEPLMFKSVGEGSQKLDYVKVYSGLYEFEGHVVLYVLCSIILNLLLRSLYRYLQP